MFLFSPTVRDGWSGFWLFVTIFRHISELVDGLQSQSPNGAARASEVLVAAFRAAARGFPADLHGILAFRCAVSD